MPTSRNLPCQMCPTCANYEYRPHSGSAHYCKNPGAFTNHDKCRQNPDKDGTSSYSCKKYLPK